MSRTRRALLVSWLAGAAASTAAAVTVIAPAAGGAQPRVPVPKFKAPSTGLHGARLAESYGSTAADTATPIKHLVVIYQENVSFDHYFATYPYAQNKRSEPKFTAHPGTPTVNGLGTPLLAGSNPNSYPPFRLDRLQASTCDQNHNYADEQAAMNKGLMDLFPETLGSFAANCAAYGFGKNLVMGYFDGNTTTALWNYAQHYAMSDNSFSTTFGPSTPGAINLISGQTHGVDPAALRKNPAAELSANGQTIVGDPQPFYDDCSTRDSVGLKGRNVGDLLNTAGVSWGFFQGGFRPTAVSSSGVATCGATHVGADGQPKGDYIPHHQPFQYYKSTSNPHHLAPTSVAMIGRQGDRANHQYDLSDFWSAVNAGHLPAVSFLKAPGYQDGHAGYSNPLLEQRFIVEAINRLQARREWSDTAVVIAYDDSDGWYDHQMPPIVNQSQDANDRLTGIGQCGTKTPMGGADYQGRCGYGPRQPLLVVSPWARSNYVDHSITDQSSILQAIQDNWHLPRSGDASFDQRAGSLVTMFDFSRRGGSNRRLQLNPETGQPAERSDTAASRRRYVKNSNQHHKR